MTLTELEAVAEECGQLLFNDIELVVPESEDDGDDYVKTQLIDTYQNAIIERGYFLIGDTSFSTELIGESNLWEKVRGLIWLAVQPQCVGQYFGQIKEWFDSRINDLPDGVYVPLRRLYFFFEHRCVFFKDGTHYHGIQTQTHFDLFVKLCDSMVDMYLFEKGLKLGEVISNNIIQRVRAGKIDQQKAYIGVMDLVFDYDQKILFGQKRGKKIGLDIITFVECIRPIKDYLEKRPPVATSAVEVVGVGTDKKDQVKKKPKNTKPTKMQRLFFNTVIFNLKSNVGKTAAVENAATESKYSIRQGWNLEAKLSKGELVYPPLTAILEST